MVFITLKLKENSRDVISQVCYNIDMNSSELTVQKIAQLSDLFKQEALTCVGLFGSQSRGEATDSSDVDILIDYSHPKSLFNLARIKLQLEDVLGKKVDLVSRGAVKPKLKASIEQDLIVVYGQR